MMEDEYGLRYHGGYGNEIESECREGALPRRRNNPRIVPYGLFAEQLSGTAFTAPRKDNRRTWLYRIRPSVAGTSSGFEAVGDSHNDSHNDIHNDIHNDSSGDNKRESRFFGGVNWQQEMKLDPNPMRWGATPLERDSEADFVRGMKTMLGSGDPAAKSGIAVYVYACRNNMIATDHPSFLRPHKPHNSNNSRNPLRPENKPDHNCHFYNSDGDFLIVPQNRGLWIQTEMGILIVLPGDICVIPRGIVFAVNILPTNHHNQTDQQDDDDNYARGYVLEIFRGHFTLPELGPIGSNGLANARDFYHPTAYYDPNQESHDLSPCTIYTKFGQRLFRRHSNHSPYNVVAYHGNYLPYKYSLKHFCAMNSVTYDHPDPSIFTVLTAKGDEDGTALADFVVFPSNRTLATDENTFRPPWFHRNVMTEFMGLIYGEYDAKASTTQNGKGGGGGGGFVPGGCSLHPIMTPHGPDDISYYKNIKDPCNTPKKLDGGLAFMFESSAMCKVSNYATNCIQREYGYANCWDGLKPTFPHELNDI